MTKNFFSRVFLKFFMLKSVEFRNIGDVCLSDNPVQRHIAIEKLVAREDSEEH
jgi:hypothetical protein